MSNSFFEKSLLNSPYAYPRRHYRYGSETRTFRPDFKLLVEDTAMDQATPPTGYLA